MFANFLYLALALVASTTAADQQHEFPKFQQWFPSAQVHHQHQQAQFDQQVAAQQQHYPQFQQWTPYGQAGQNQQPHQYWQFSQPKSDH